MELESSQMMRFAGWIFSTVGVIWSVIALASLVQSAVVIDNPDFYKNAFNGALQLYRDGRDIMRRQGTILRKLASLIFP
jgi:hypothetical protein